ncbi:MAG: ORF6N domain-containing protein [bacterium]|nr:ORF6N domain-containing protein [bacterium]
MQPKPRRTPYFLMRDRKVWLDHDIAAILRIPTGRLNRVVKRHPERFPASFSFILDQREVAWIRARSDIANIRFRSRKYLPRVYTYPGIIMASSLLRTPKALAATLHFLTPLR